MDSLQFQPQDATALIAAVLANPTALAVLRTLAAAQKPESPTVRECWAHYRNKPKSSNSQRKCGYVWHAQLEPFFGNMRVDELTIQHVEEFRAKRRKDRTKTRSKFTQPATRNSELKLLKSCLSWAVLTQKIARNPLVGLKEEPSDGTRDTLLNDGMLQACLAFADLDMRAFILVCIGSGLRKMECAKLKWSDLDLEVGLVWLRADLSKTKKRRTTLLTDAALEALRELRYPKAHDVPPGLSNVEKEVYRAIREGSNTWDALKQRLKVSQPTLMPVIHRLAVRRLVERTPSPHGTGTQFLSTRGFKVLPFSYPGGSPEPNSPWVFPSPTNPMNHIPDQTLSWRWHEIRRKAGITGADGQVWIHDMRRTFGSNLIARGASLAEVLSLGGWTSPEVFIRHYARISPERMTELRSLTNNKKEASHGTP